MRHWCSAIGLGCRIEGLATGIRSSSRETQLVAGPVCVQGQIE
jgi:hypothetical protein